MNRGKVYLVGAGPGDLKLITIKGLELIKQADVIIYDHLVNQKLLCYAKKEVELIYAGKSSHHHSLEQSKINQLMIKKAAENKVVVRLKGGDPFVFGRGAEEALGLADENIPFEIVPGITSAIAAPAYAGIPLTHRDYNSSFTVITGHQARQGKSRLEWDKLSSGEDTLVILMGVANLEEIVRGLLKQGRKPDTAVAAIGWGTTLQQAVIVGTLQTIVEKTKKQNLKPPAVIVVGNVVNLRKRLNWFESRPLYGKRILVTRAKAQASGLTDLLEEQGACVIELPVIEIAPPSSFKKLDQAITWLNRYDWIIFTSVNGVRYFLKRLQDMGKSVAALKEIKLCAIGPETAKTLEEYGLAVNCMPKDYRQEGIITQLGKEGLKGKTILLPRAENAREVLQEALSRMGAKLEVATVYRTVKPPGNLDEISSLLAKKKVDIVTFTSSSAVKNFIELLGKKKAKEIFQGSLVACIGPVTRKTAQRLGIKVDIVAGEFTMPGLVEAIVRHFKPQEREKEQK